MKSSSFRKRPRVGGRLHAATMPLALMPLLLLGGCQQSEPSLQVAARIQAAAIRECSGIVASRQHPGVFWVHNDSGSAAQIFAIDAEGHSLCEVNVQGVSNIDWEDLTLDDAGNLYVGDFGNNRNDRRNLEVLVIREPDPEDCEGGTHEVGVERRIPFHFPEQQAFPNPERMNFDCEAMFWLEGSLYVFTKHRSDSRTVLYRLPTGSDTEATRLWSFDAGGMVTAATVRHDGKVLLVLTYDILHRFELPEGAASLERVTGPHQSMVIEARQCEAICFDGDDIVVTNEQREIYRIDPAPWPEVLLPPSPLLRVQSTAATGFDDVEWGEASLELRPEFRDGHPPVTAPPTVHMTRSAQELFLRIDYGPGFDVTDAGEFVRVHVGRGDDRQALQPQHGDMLWKLTRAADRWFVQVGEIAGCQHEDSMLPQDTDATVEWDANNGLLQVRFPLEQSVAAAAVPLQVNLIVRRSAETHLDEWAWGASSTTWPDRNALLWGRLETTDDL